VVAEFPRDGARGVSTRTDVFVAFNESVRGVDEDSFTLERSFGAEVPAFVFRQRASDRYILEPRFRLRPHTRYTVNLEGGRSFGIHDRAGNALFDERWSFRTGGFRRFGSRTALTDIPAGVDVRTVRALAETG
jgi:hypothetical protein